MLNLLISSGENDCTLENCSLRSIFPNSDATYAAMPPAQIEQKTLPTEYMIIHVPSPITSSEVPPLFRIPPGIKFCDCKSCDFGEKCEFYNKYERLPEQYFSGAKSKCPLLKYELTIKNN